MDKDLEIHIEREGKRETHKQIRPSQGCPAQRPLPLPTAAPPGLPSTCSTPHPSPGLGSQGCPASRDHPQPCLAQPHPHIPVALMSPPEFRPWSPTASTTGSPSWNLTGVHLAQALPWCLAESSTMNTPHARPEGSSTSPRPPPPTFSARSLPDPAS